jgi:hypothetical protein
MYTKRYLSWRLRPLVHQFLRIERVSHTATWKTSMVNGVQRDDVQGIHLVNDIVSAPIILHVILQAFQTNVSHIGGMGVDGDSGCCPM